MPKMSILCNPVHINWILLIADGKLYEILIIYIFSILLIKLVIFIELFWCHRLY